MRTGNAIRIAAGLAIGLSSTAFGQVLYDNGPVATLPTGVCIPAGGSSSELQTALGLITYGFGHALSAGIRVADDFAVPAGGWTINSIEFLAYQTGSGTGASPIDHVNYQILNGPPGIGAVVFGDTTTNRLASSTFSGIYRHLDLGGCAVDRPLFRQVCTAGVTLPAGTYWIDWQTGGSLASGPWIAPTTLIGSTNTPGANAQQSIGGVWAAALDGAFQQDFPFVLSASMPPTTGACCLVSGSCVLSLGATACTSLGGTYRGDNTTCATANCPLPPGVWIETGDAGAVPGSAQVPVGSGVLNEIRGATGAGDPEDMYMINICNESVFSATTAGSSFDTQLFLFDSNGVGVSFNDDAVGLQSTVTSTFVTSNGDYFIAVSGFDRDAANSGGLEIWFDTPYDVERAPDGPGAPGPVLQWVGSGSTGTYTIAFTGTCFVGNPPVAGACCLQSGSCVLTLGATACTSQGGTYRGDNTTCATANCPLPPGLWLEVGDAGNTPATAQAAAGTGALNEIRGSTGGAADPEDMYRFEICNEAVFSATTAGSTFDTQLFLFDSNGTGVSFNDDAVGLQSTVTSTFVTSNGIYHIAVSGFDRDAANSAALEIWFDTPYGIERAPDGPGAPGPVTQWVGTGASGNYTITFTGACMVGGACYANCDGSTTAPILNVNDFVCFQQAFAAGDPYANCDGSTTPPVLNVNDFVCFQQAFAAGCP